MATEYVWVRRSPRWDLALMALLFVAMSSAIALTWWADDVLWAVAAFAAFAVLGLAVLVAALLGYVRVPTGSAR